MKDKKKIYISGPMGCEPEVQSRQLFAESQALIEAGGDIAIDPWDLQEFIPGMTEAQYLLMDLFIINMCDAIYMLPGWTGSLGARAEFKRAACQGKEIQYHEDSERMYGQKEISGYGNH